MFGNGPDGMSGNECLTAAGWHAQTDVRRMRKLRRGQIFLCTNFPIGIVNRMGSIGNDTGANQIAKPGKRFQRFTLVVFKRLFGDKNA